MNVKTDNKISVPVSAFKAVFSRPLYITLAIIIALLILWLAIWLPNFSLFSFVLKSDFDLAAKLSIFWSSFGTLNTNFTSLTRALTIIVAGLSGINIALLVFYLKNRIKLEKVAGTGILGTIAGLLGVGCTSCGSVILSSIFGLSASASFVGIFPLKGAEFGILGIAILLLSIYLLAQKISNPLVCRIK